MKRLAGAILKYLILIIAGVPLAWGAWYEFSRLGQASIVRLTVGYPDAAPQALQRLQPLAGTDVLRKAELLAPLVTLARQTRIASAELADDEKPLAAALQEHASSIDDTWKLFTEYERLRIGGPLPNDKHFPFPKTHPYFECWHTRYQVVELETRIVNMRRDRPEDVDEAQELIEQYRLLPGSNPAFHQLQVGDVEGYELRYESTLDIDAMLVRYFASGSSEQVILETRNQLQKRLENLEAFGRKFTEPKDYVNWAKLEAQRCILTRDLIRTDEASRNFPLDRRVAEFAKFVATSGASSAVVDVVRQTIHALCESRLDPKLPPDDLLFVLRHDDDEEAPSVPRADVIIVWDDRSMEFLNDTDFDEYTLPVDKVRRLIVRNFGTRPPLLKPTPKSEAAHVYSVGRRGLAWNPTAIGRLRALCEPHQSELGTTWQSLVELDELAGKYAEFFPAVIEKKKPAVKPGTTSDRRN